MKLILALLVFFSFMLFLTNTMSAQGKAVSIGATVGTITLSVSGYQSPYASIILKTKTGTFIASTTSDANGYFYISNRLINASELTYCFAAVDFKRVGLSESCIAIPGPIAGDLVYSDVFLPPTIGLSTKKINAGQDAIIFGYSMPGATVHLSISGNVVSVTADAGGYYSYIYENVPEGTFTISATASLVNNKSLTPTNDVVLESLSISEQLIDTGEKITEEIKKKAFLPFNLWPFILLVLAFLTAIGILLYKLKLGHVVPFIYFFRKRKKIHHDWLLDHW